MADREKVIKGLEGIYRCISPVNHTCGDCPYQDNHVECERRVINDAITLLKEQQETITSLQSTICKLNAALAEQPKQKFFVDSDGKMTPLPVQKHGHWISVIKGNGHYTCSCCGTGRYMNFVPDYCSSCGARMDEEVKQDG